MPLKIESPMEQRQRSVSLAESGHFIVSELCEQFGISRNAAYKWIGRYQECGSGGIEDRSREPKQEPGRTGTKVERFDCGETIWLLQSKVEPVELKKRWRVLE